MAAPVKLQGPPDRSASPSAPSIAHYALSHAALCGICGQCGCWVGRRGEELLTRRELGEECMRSADSVVHSADIPRNKAGVRSWGSVVGCATGCVGVQLLSCFFHNYAASLVAWGGRLRALSAVEHFPGNEGVSSVPWVEEDSKAVRAKVHTACPCFPVTDCHCIGLRP